MHKSGYIRAGKALGENLGSRRARNLMTIILIALAPVLMFATYLVLGGLDGAADPKKLRAVVMIDIMYVIAVAALIAMRIARMVTARKQKSAGSRLHMRLMQIFSLVALVPTIVVAIFATITLNFGLEGWFSDRVRNVVGNSLAAAEAYENEQRINLQEDIRALSQFLNTQKNRNPQLNESEFRSLLERGQTLIQRGLKEAYVIDGAREILARGQRSYLFGYDEPSADAISRARSGEIVVIEDWEKNEFRALAVLPSFSDRFLYVGRDVDGEILSLLDQTKETIALYQQLESDRGRLLFEFGLVYLAFAVIVILAAIWGALWFAELIARPVGRLASAAKRVGAGDFDVRVREDGGDDEIAFLGTAFNRMTEQVKEQRDELIEANTATERRRRLFDSILSSVTAGVIGLDADGNVVVVNNTAVELLGVDPEYSTGQPIGDVAPDLTKVFDDFKRSTDDPFVAEIEVSSDTRSERLLVQIASRGIDGEIEGYVVTFDDITQLVAAQRMAAWGDVARRIAHEIKNPLTPIQLSAQRLRQKIGPLLGDDREMLDQYADVISRQTEDLRRIVDEFSKFARMPAPEIKSNDLGPVLKNAILLAETGNPNITYETSIPPGEIAFKFDSTMMSQVFNNILKNAAEATESYIEKTGSTDFKPTIKVSVEFEKNNLVISIADNGIGLPEKRSNLFEPYVTHRKEGTGLGLSIVKKIVEEHSGKLFLDDAPVFDGCDHSGALVQMKYPVLHGADAADPREDLKVA
jgi:two-component system nitrogen regulation sensor histidine kinase NtrY